MTGAPLARPPLAGAPAAGEPEAGAAVAGEPEAGPAGTAPSPLLSWLVAPRTDRAVRFARGSGGWDRYSYADLAHLVSLASAALRARALPGRPGVVLATPNSVGFVTGYFGAVNAGLVPTAIAPPARFGSREDYVRHVARVLELTGASAVVGEPVHLAVLKDAAEAASEAGGVPVAVLSSDFSTGTETDRLSDVPTTELATLQFTSGSTSSPRGVRITWANMEANAAGNARLISFDGGQSTVSWVPMYHDLGLVGCLMTIVAKQGDLTLMRPEQFVYDPRRWIDCIAREGIQITAAPSFGFAYAARRLTPGDLEGADFSTLRSAALGAERHDPRGLWEFTRLCEPYGFDPATFTPCYGMAEMTLGITGHPPGTVPQAVHLDWQSLTPEQPVKVVARGTLRDAGPSGTPAEWLVSSGIPIDGVSVAVVDGDGRPLPDGYLGELVLSGTSTAAGYEPADADSSSRFADGKVFSGDAGFLLDGQTYVLGRLGDALSVRGRNIYAEDLDVRLADTPGVDRHRCATLVDADRIVVLAELAPGPWAERLAESLSLHVGGVVDVTVVGCRRGTIQRTSSGKPRRRLMLSQYLEQKLAGEVVAHRPRRPEEG
ncbi:AMP-binding protein [Streptomyces sparsogenes]|uniref:AMP-binding protein n=1 Tax=Streptomyces sparsogenes TaxID=67365 RepID=UPI00340824C7